MLVQKDAFLKAYETHADAIYRHCFFRVFRRELAEELMQETFMKTWTYLADGKKVDNIRAFLYKVATNLIIDESRKRKEESLDALLEVNPTLEPASSDHIRTEHNLALKEIVVAFNKVDKETQQILTLRYVDDLDPRDIGEILGITANHASVKISRALEEVKQVLQP